MSRTVQVRQISHITLESLTANIAVKNFSRFLLSIAINLPNVLVNVQALFSSNQHAFMPACIDDGLILILLLLGAGLNHFFQLVLFPSKIVNLSTNTVDHFALVTVGH
jgi:hypothetical protein